MKSNPCEAAPGLSLGLRVRFPVRFQIRLFSSANPGANSNSSGVPVYSCFCYFFWQIFLSLSVLGDNFMEMVAHIDGRMICRRCGHMIKTWNADVKCEVRSVER